MGESTIDIQCLFIHGSDAVGCEVVLVSDHPGVNNETETLLKKNTSSSAFGQLNLTLKAACYHRVLAYTFDVNYTTNNFYIEEMLFSNHSVTNIECSGKKNNNKLIIYCDFIDKKRLILGISLSLFTPSFHYIAHTLSEDGSNINITIKTIIGVSVGCVVVVMVIILIMVTVSVVRSKKSHCHDQANNDTTIEGTELF